ncbi:unnamed protein product [Cuscuta campestris]|uniref:F-box/LRR-repeat protein 15/At3g58940/PEG3-like LRR domain-containing protein n=1 Tax=Cuscuta campestris TaxID=132261 RepID=A0A484NPG3_9ASTE|nr:unnamed protein product [Cuscuta campestris]
MARSVVGCEADARDRISQLPVKILDHIMGLLPIREAARTAVLSKPSDDLGEYSCLYAINKVLLHHKGSIRKFVFLHSRVERLTVGSLSFHMPKWLLLVTRKGVEEIELHLRGEAYELPVCLFSCSTLTRLHLCSLSIEPLSSPCTLPNVTYLIFERVCFGIRSLPNCVVDAPKLKNLSFLHCEDVFHFNITARNLCTLRINGFYGSKLGIFLPANLDLNSISTLIIDTRILEYFLGRYTAKQFMLQLPSLNVEQLSLRFLCFQHDVAASAFACLLCKCPKLCHLEICFLWVGDRNKCIDATSKHLKKLRSVARTHKMLLSLKLSYFDGSWFQMHFIQEMLACLPAFENVVIDGNGLNKEPEAMEEISRFPRASAKATIVFQ